MSQQPSEGQPSADVQKEREALHEEAQKAQAAFGGTADVPGAAGAVESEPDQGTAAPGQPTQGAGGEGATESAGGGQQEGGREYPEPSTGEMFASEVASEPSMEWEGKVAEKLSGAEGETAGTEKT